jgi:methionyl-tRNA formyltransferase
MCIRPTSRIQGGLALESLTVNGEQLVITVHRITPEFDEGPWLVKTHPQDIDNLDIQSIARIAAVKGAKALEEALLRLCDGTAVFISQVA